MNEVKVDDILQQIRLLSKQLEFDPSAAESSVADQPVSFSNVLKNSIDHVNAQQKQAGEMAKSFELGDPDANLSEVMIQMQKARVSFETLSQVRNKLISAYQEVMSMQV